MDATMHCAVFHLQNKHYDETRPPTFFDHDDLNKLNLTRNRRRHIGEEEEGYSVGQQSRRLSSVYDCEKEYSMMDNTLAQQPGTPVGDDGSVSSNISGGCGHRPTLLTPPSRQRRRTKEGKSPLPAGMLEGHWGIIPPTPEMASSSIVQRTTLNSQYFPSSQCPNKNFAYRPNGHTPPLFLQELAHLSSLACAVALSTLRNDIEMSESPLDVYVPGSAWPPSDPDKLPKHIKREFQHNYRIITIVRHWLGLDRLPHWRSKYNASRPLLIIGGVSDGEIHFLQMARGPYAKAQLALSWLEQFIIEEHLDGSLGEVHSAIISRMVQFMSDGMLHYNQARKIMYIPFPFPHAQLSVFFMVTMIVAVPFLMEQYTSIIWIGSLMSFMTVTCLAGLHEVARELENPFRNVPNEIPLCTLQAMYNEALVTMFSGYNPDSFWDAEMYQGMLEAMAMGKVNQQPRKSPTEEESSSSEAKETILEMPVLSTEATGQDATEDTRKKKSVSFAIDDETDGDIANQLRQTLAKQALKIEELERSLDGEESSSNQKTDMRSNFWRQRSSFHVIE